MLRLCTKKTAQEPFYAASIGINIYTMEELCFFLFNYIPLVEETFYSEEAVRWIASEMELRETAQAMERALRRNQGLMEFIFPVFRAIGYLTREEFNRCGAEIAAFEKLPEAEKERERGCALQRAGKYGRAIRIYHRLLLNGEGTAQIRYELGMAQLHMMFFDEAAASFEKAYETDPSETNADAYRTAVCMAYPEEKAREILLGKGEDPDTIRKTQEKVFAARSAARRKVSEENPDAALAAAAEDYHRMAET